LFFVFCFVALLFTCPARTGFIEQKRGLMLLFL